MFPKPFSEMILGKKEKPFTMAEGKMVEQDIAQRLQRIGGSV